jgi:hypothetical protein
MYIIGGFDGEKLNQVWKINVESLCYERINAKHTQPIEMKPMLEGSPPSNSSQKQFRTDKETSKLLLNILPAFDEWSMISGSTEEGTGSDPEGRTGHSIAFYDDQLLVFGGVNSKNVCISMNQIDIYDFGSKAWQRVKCSGDVPSLRSSMDNTKLTEDTCFFFGGYYLDEYYKDAFIFRLDKKEWVQLSEALNEANRRANYSVAGEFDQVFIFGGRDKALIYRDLVKVTIDYASNTAWSEKLATIGEEPSNRFGHVSILKDQSMYCQLEEIDFCSEAGMERNVSTTCLSIQLSLTFGTTYLRVQ